MIGKQTISLLQDWPLRAWGGGFAAIEPYPLPRVEGVYKFGADLFALRSVGDKKLIRAVGSVGFG